FKIPPEFVISFVATSESDNRDTGGQIAVGREVVQRGDEFAMGEMARGAKDYNGARLRHCASGKPFPERVWFRLISGSMPLARAELVRSLMPQGMFPRQTAATSTSRVHPKY